MRSPLILALLLTFGVMSTAIEAANWGSFDSTRIHKPAAFELSGGSLLVNLRQAITSAGGTVLPGTPTLSSKYLATVDVFYTSLLDETNGILSNTEQADLQKWIAAGGTLIVTGKTFSLKFYDSFTSYYGITQYQALLGSGYAYPTSLVHPITAIKYASYSSCCTFIHPKNANLLMTTASGGGGSVFMVVMEPASGHTSGGRILVLGDGEMFSDQYWSGYHNYLLGQNMIQWAHTPPCTPASWWNYGAGWPGTTGIPGIAATGNPIIGSPLTVGVGNSLGLPTSTMLLLSHTSASTPTPLGGTLLVVVLPPFSFLLPMPAAGLSVTGVIPNDPSLCGIPLYMQALMADAGASHGVSFTPGLQLNLGS